MFRSPKFFWVQPKKTSQPTNFTSYSYSIDHAWSREQAKPWWESIWISHARIHSYWALRSDFLPPSGSPVIEYIDIKVFKSLPHVVQWNFEKKVYMMLHDGKKFLIHLIIIMKAKKIAFYSLAKIYQAALSFILTKRNFFELISN